MIKVIFYAEEEIERKETNISEVETYIQLVKKYGFMDTNGNAYKFNSAQVDHDGIYIYLDAV